jgi:two-component system, chemotaxis family, response regulator Rcp1
METDSYNEILLIEDRPGDIRLTKEAFELREMPVRLHHVWDGPEAMEFLKCEGRFEDAPRPMLIVLDLHLPGMSGEEVLARIKDDPDLKVIPTIVLTTSESPADVMACYKLGANCFLQKPVDWDQFEHLVKCIAGFWLKKILKRKTAVVHLA